MFKFLQWVLFPIKLTILDAESGGNAGGNASEQPDSNSSQIEYPEGLEEGLKGDPTLAKFVKDGKFNYANVLKSYVNAQKLIGKEKVALPGKNATDADWEGFYNKIGRPDLEKYELQLKQGQEANEEFLSKYKQTAHKAGLLPKQAEHLFNWYYDEIEGAQKAVLQEHNDKMLAEVENLKKEWGYGYDKEVDIAKRALKNFVSDEEMESLKSEGLTSNVKFVRLMNKIGKALKEDSFKHESAGTFGLTKEEAQNKINAMYADTKGAYWNKSNPQHRKAIEDMMKLNEIVSS